MINPLKSESIFTLRGFLRALALCYLAAFASAGAQFSALVGSEGVAPLGRHLATLAQSGMALAPLPTAFALSSSDAVIAAVPWIGAAASLIAALGFVQFPMLLLAWFLYFSIVHGGQSFFSFQWDTLLLETGFLALFVCPFGWTEKRAFARNLPATAIWLPRWLLFRLMFRSGVVKLASGDPTWAAWTALDFHFETQPLPGPLSWALHNGPVIFKHVSTGLTLGIELVLPWLMFFGRWPRLVAAAGFAVLQVAIIGSGNYGFFNVLTLVLTLTLLDDGFLKKSVAPSLPPPGRARQVVTGLALAVLVLLGSFPELLGRWRETFVVNQYGLFSVMTTERKEIELEGSTDGKEWKLYRLPYKPSDVERLPPFLLLHMPRLDWQMWFAALGTHHSNPWLFGLVEGMLRGSPSLLALFEENPFPEAPPRFVRASLYRYHFTNPEERATGAGWWRREQLDPYLPPLSLSGSSGERAPPGGSPPTPPAP